MTKFNKKLAMQWQYHVMLVPAIVLVFIFSYIPLYGLVMAFQKYNPGKGFWSPWVGMANYRFLFGQPNFVSTIWNTLFIAFFKIFGGIAVSVVFALLLNEVTKTRTRRVFQTLVYIPNFLSWVVFSGILIDILAADGIVNQIVKASGGSSINFLGDLKLFPWTLILTDIWKTFGFGTVVYLAALSSIDPELYEAALMDGAMRWKQTVYITLPLIRPIVMLMMVLSLGNILNAGFEQVYNLYSPVVYSTGDIIDTYVYRLAFLQAQYSVATAVGMFKSLISGILIALSYFLADRLAGYRVF